MGPPYPTLASPVQHHEPAAERMKINFSWLVKLRWAGGVGQLITILVVRFGLGIDLALIPLVILVTLGFVSNAAVQFWIAPRFQNASARQWEALGDWLLGWVCVLDILILSGLVYYSGGPSNPFSIFYLVNLTLAAAVLRPRWAWVVMVVAILGYVVLMWFHVPVVALGDVVDPSSVSQEVRQWARQRQLFHWGLQVALATSATFIVYFITRVTTELAQREQELSEAQRLRAESEKLEALGTLAAGAAHELATPLSTIAVVARELEVHLERQSADEQAVTDARLIRTEVGRCREILDHMASDAGEATGEALNWTTAEDLMIAIRDGLSHPESVELVYGRQVAEACLYVPHHALAQALRGLVKNALDATDSGEPVLMRGEFSQHCLTITIEDHGRGMPPEILQRAGNPFFTTKDPGKGMGLGLFLARRVIERQGGSMRIESTPGEGTIVIVRLYAQAAQNQPESGQGGTDSGEAQGSQSLKSQTSVPQLRDPRTAPPSSSTNC